MKRHSSLSRNLVLILISFLIISEGNIFIPGSYNTCQGIYFPCNNDIDIPGDENNNGMPGIEKWLNSEYNNTTVPFISISIAPVLQDFKSCDYQRTIWQPPKLS